MTTSLNSLLTAYKAADEARLSNDFARAVALLSAVDLSDNEHGWVVMAARALLAGCEAAVELEEIARKIEGAREKLEDGEACAIHPVDLAALTRRAYYLAGAASAVRYNSEATANGIAENARAMADQGL